MRYGLAILGLLVLGFALYLVTEKMLCVNEYRHGAAGAFQTLQEIRDHCWSLRNPFDSI